jgi:hypothetical protein
MFSFTNHIFDMSNKILEQTPHVHINTKALVSVAEEMVKSPMIKKQVDAKYISMERESIQEIVLKELVADSINYCYWQYNSEYRPNGAGSSLMRNILDESFDAKLAMHSNIDLEYQLRNFYRCLMVERFPLMDKRLQHLTALTRQMPMIAETARSASHIGQSVGRLFTEMVCDDMTFNTLFKFLITEIDGYGDDPFLKRASLFFLQLNRILGMFPTEIRELPIPADYQVPKMMWSYSLIQYSPELERKIFFGEHLIENSPEEMALRAAAVVVGFQLAIRTGWSPSDVDGWFFIRRNECQKPFHLCITSNY